MSNKTVNSIEKRKNDIIAMTNIKHGIQLIKFIKMPLRGNVKSSMKSQIDETTQGPPTQYSVHSNMNHGAVRSSHITPINRNGNIDSNSSIVVSEAQLPTGEKIFDHRVFLEKEPRARLISITVYGYKYITAIQTKYLIPDEDEPRVSLHFGTAHDKAKKNEMHKETLEIENNENIELIHWCWWSENHRIRGITLVTSFDKCLILEGQVELNYVLDMESELSELDKMENESIPPESEANLSIDNDNEEEVQRDLSVENNQAKEDKHSKPSDK